MVEKKPPFWLPSRGCKTWRRGQGVGGVRLMATVTVRVRVKVRVGIVVGGGKSTCNGPSLSFLAGEGGDGYSFFVYLVNGMQFNQVQLAVPFSPCSPLSHW
jgi:hypothetical protein